MSIAGSPLSGRVLFVEGAPRSGTTLLVSMLATHPEIAGTVAESHLFDRGIGLLFDNHGRQSRYEGFLSNYVSEQELADLARDLCDGVLCAMRSRVKPDARMVVEKTPLPQWNGEVAMERKVTVYPDAAYVHVVREREGVVRSLLRAPWAEVDEDEAGEWWERAVAAVRETAGRADSATYVEIAYEELAADPVGVVTGVLEGLGLDVDGAARERLEIASRERLSSFGPPAPGPRPADRNGAQHAAPARGRGARARLRAAAADLARRLESRRSRRAAVARDLIVAARRGDSALVDQLTHPSFAFVFRSGAGDLSTDGDGARSALLAVAAETFHAQAVSEKWMSISEGETVALLLGAGFGDGRRTDLVATALVRRGVVERLSVIAAGEPGGREPRRWRRGTERAGPEQP